MEQEESLIKDSWLYNVPKHIVHKPILIDKMRLIPQNRIDQISHTDYNLPAGMIVEWREYFLKNIYHQFKLDFEDKVKSNIGLHNAWFQWYEKNDYHVWHIHGGVHFTNIYYLSLPNKEVKTTVKHIEQLKSFDVMEGQILTIPSYWWHKSPVNLFDDPKIIISFNTSIKMNE